MCVCDRVCVCDHVSVGSVQPTFRRKQRKTKRDFFAQSKKAKHVRQTEVEEWRGVEEGEERGGEKRGDVAHAWVHSFTQGGRW